MWRGFPYRWARTLFFTHTREVLKPQVDKSAECSLASGLVWRWWCKHLIIKGWCRIKWDYGEVMVGER